MKHILLLILLFSFSFAGKVAVFHYRGGSTIKQGLYAIDSITFADYKEQEIRIDSIKYKESHGSLPPEHCYCKTLVLREYGDITYKTYQGYEENEDSLDIKIELAKHHTYFDELAEPLENKCGKQLDGDFSNRDLIGGPGQQFILFFNDGTVTHFRYNSTSYPFVPDVIRNLDKTIVDTLIKGIDEELNPTKK